MYYMVYKPSWQALAKVVVFMAATSLETILKRFDGQQRDALLPILWEVQTAYGHIDAQAAETISRALRVPVADVYGVISFYSLLTGEPTGETVIRVCGDPACGIAGADAVVNDLCGRLGIQPGDTTRDGRYSVQTTTCLGQCDRAPAALISRRGEGESVCALVTDDGALLQETLPAPQPTTTGGDRHVFLATVNGETETLADYGDYRALRHALVDLTPEAVSTVVEASGLVGRGGAAFPTGTKWRYTRQASGQPHYVICNADESEPGTFKDRVLLEQRPHLLLEGIALCAYAVGAQQCYVFVRGEYPEATRRIESALREADAAGLVGDHVMGTSFSCRITIRRGAGAYICGEETALFEAMEGRRGFPRIKPPYPTTHGLFGKPTVVNNVETLCAVPGIVQHGADWYRQWGTQKSTGTKLVAVSGHVNRPGVYEIPFGVSLCTLIEQHCGGVTGTLQAVLMGGAAGTFLTPDEIDVPLSFEGMQAAGSTLGSGAIMVFNQSVDLRDVLRRLGRFFAHESCGKCFPCQLGTQRQVEILERLDRALPGDRERLADVGLTMTQASLCGLGQTAASAVLSAIERWPELVGDNDE